MCTRRLINSQIACASLKGAADSGWVGTQMGTRYLLSPTYLGR